MKTGFTGLIQKAKSNREDFAVVPVRNDMGLDEEGVDGQQGVPPVQGKGIRMRRIREQGRMRSQE